MEKQADTYLKYRNLSETQRYRRISQAQQKQENRCQNPQTGHQFLQHNFIDFIVKQEDRNIRLHTYRYLNENHLSQKPKAVIILFHGLNSHIGRTAHIAHFFSKLNIVCVGYDYRGFGRSQGQRAYVSSWNLHIQDAKLFSDKVKQLYKHIPLFCLGQSMGGLTCYHLTFKFKQLFDGVIFICPAFKTHFGSFVTGFSNILAKILPKNTRLLRPFSGRSIGNPQVSEQFYNDPYSTVRERSSLSTLNILMQTMQVTNQTFKQYDIPFIIVQGGLDKVINPIFAFQLYDNCKTSYKFKKILFYEEMWHDLLHQQKIFDVLKQISKWLQIMIHELTNKKQ